MSERQLRDLAAVYRANAQQERGEKQPSIYLIKWFELQAVLCEREATQLARQL